MEDRYLLTVTRILFCMVICSVTGSDTTCKVSGCSNNGVCLHSADRQTCVCHEGWTGADCSMDINECVLDVCGSHGICINTQGGFQCICKSGHGGSRCQHVGKGTRRVMKRLLGFKTPPPPPTSTTVTTASPPPLTTRTPPTPHAINTPKPIVEHSGTTNSPPPLTTTTLVPPPVGK